jgi:hypothetical protein
MPFRPHLFPDLALVMAQLAPPEGV